MVAHIKPSRAEALGKALRAKLLAQDDRASRKRKTTNCSAGTTGP